MWANIFFWMVKETMLIGIILFCMGLSYIVGTIPFGHLIASVKGIDIKNVGTGNPGATNVYKEVGSFYGVLVFFIDIGKGLIIPVIVIFMGSPIWVASLCLFSLILGHVTPSPWKTPSGTGMAAAMGASLALVPLGGLICIIPAAIVLKISKNSTYTGVCAFLIAMVSDWLILSNFIEVGTVLVCALIILLKFLVQYRNLND